ncbi:MAG: MBL fold metallo-hydrolase [Rhodothermales bacterium]
MLFRQIFEPKLAQYAYLIGCQPTKEAILIDPQRDIDRYVAMAKAEGVRIIATAETHIHADFLSGVREFAEQHGTHCYLSDAGTADWKSNWAKEDAYDVTFLCNGDTFRIGNIGFTVTHNPGHTPEHISFLVTDHGGGADDPMGLVSGDFVFVGALGRPDLLETAAGHIGAQSPSAERLYHSVIDFLDLPDHVQVWPGHGAGSACGKSLGAVPQSTVGYERRFNPSIDVARQGAEPFIDAILDGQPEPPMYFARMKQQNRDGVPLLGELPMPKRLSAGDLAALPEDTILLDTRRDRSAALAQHIPGSLYTPFNKQFNTLVGCYVTDAKTPLVLLLDEADVDEAVRDLVRIGYDHIVGYVPLAELDAYLNQHETACIEEIDFADVEARRQQPGMTVVDVRRRDEYESGHIPGALNAAHTRLAEHLDRLPRGGTLLVHCLSGGRSAYAAAYLAQQGFSVVYVNDHFSNYRTAYGVAKTDLAPA